MLIDEHAECVTRGDFRMLLLDGVSVSLIRSSENGQLMVHVNTEDSRDSRDTAPDGDPVLMVTLNDATLYDREFWSPRASVRQATWSNESEAYEV